MECFDKINEMIFQIDRKDNVGTALSELSKDTDVKITGEYSEPEIRTAENIPKGHKIALENIKAGEMIIKYGVVIGRSTSDIAKGSWVHLHVMKSLYDERSEHLDIITGVPKDTKYE